MDLKLKRVGDMYLMEEFTRYRSKKQALVKLNHYRLYLQVFTLLDIVEGSSDSICKMILKGKQN